MAAKDDLDGEHHLAQEELQPAKRLATPWRLRWQSMWLTIRKHPSTLVVPLLLFCAVTSVGIWLVLAASSNYASTLQNQARAFGKSYSLNLQMRMQQLLLPITLLKAYVSRAPMSWALLKPQFFNLSQEVITAQQSNVQNPAIGTIIIPQATLGGMYPQALPLNLTVGLNMFALPSYLDFGLEAIDLMNGALLGGPSVTGKFGTLVYYMRALWLTPPTYGNGSLITRIPNDVPRANCSSCFEIRNGTVFWGFVVSLGIFDSVLALSELNKAKYSFELIAPNRDAVTMPRTAPWNAMVTVVHSTPKPAGNHITVPFIVDPSNATWYLHLSLKSGTWYPVWKWPLVAVVMVAALVLATLQFLVLLSWRQHSGLLRSLLPEEVLVKLRVNQHQLPDKQKNLMSGTPAEMMLDLLASGLSGDPMDVQTAVMVRSAILDAQDIYRPIDLGNQLKESSLDSDVVEALRRQFGEQTSIVMRPHGMQPERRTHGRADDLDLNGIIMGEDGNEEGEGADQKVASSNFPTLQAALCAIVCRDDSKFCNTATINGLLEINQSTDEFYTTSTDNTGVDPDCAVNGRANGTPKARPRRGAALPATQASGSLLATADLTCQQSETSGVGVQRQISTLAETLLAGTSDWAFDAMALAEATRGHPLSALGYYVLASSGLLDVFQIKGHTLARYLCRMEALYAANPYHNATHAADVLQTTHVMLTRGQMQGFTDHLGKLACYMAAIMHDVGHPGRTNDFLVATSDDIALRYNDKAPLENHHCSVGFTLLKRPGLDFLENLSRDERTALRKMVIELVLGTDMRQHFAIVSQFKVVHKEPLRGHSNGGMQRGSEDPRDRGSSAQKQQQHLAAPAPAAKVAGGAKATVQITTLADPLAALSLPITPQLDDAGKLLTLQMMLKCSDLGHLAAPLPVHLRWVAQLEEEFFNQGDAEKLMGLPVSPLFDRQKPGVSKSQVGFIEWAVLPMFTAMEAAVPSTGALLAELQANHQHWQLKGASESADGKQ